MEHDAERVGVDRQVQILGIDTRPVVEVAQSAVVPPLELEVVSHRDAQSQTYHDVLVANGVLEDDRPARVRSFVMKILFPGVVQEADRRSCHEIPARTGSTIQVWLE